MEWETFLETLLKLIEQSNNARFVIYAVATCIATQVVKKVFVNKVKVEIFHKFNFAVLLPFVIGALVAVGDALLLQKVQISGSVLYDVAVEGISIGATATAIFRFVSSLSGESVASLQKDDVFSVIFNQIVFFGSVKNQLAEGKISFADFVKQVKLISSNAKSIYDEDICDSEKKSKLEKLLGGILSQEGINASINTLHASLIAVSEKKAVK